MHWNLRLSWRKSFQRCHSKKPAAEAVEAARANTAEPCIPETRRQAVASGDHEALKGNRDRPRKKGYRR
jgi:hypothetical protein